MKIITSLFIYQLIFLFGFCNNNSIKPKSSKLINEKHELIEQKQDTIIPKVPLISFTAVGDVMFGSNFPSNASLPPSNQLPLLNEADSLLKSTDFTFGNSEGTFLNSGGTPKGSGQNIYCFRQPESFAANFKNSGFDLISIANNHINDFGELGIISTTRLLESNELNYAGIPSHPYTIVKKGELKIGFIAFAPHSGCLDMNDINKAKSLVSELKKKTDIVFVSFHGGAEGTNAQHVTRKKEIFYDQDRGNVFDFAHTMIDAGADVIIGHGPHVVRALELYHSRFIAYSLGNFCTYGMFNLSGVSGIATMLQFNLNSKGEFVNGNIHSFKQINEGGPIIDTDRKAVSIIQKLTTEDFPEGLLKISDNGYLEPIIKKD